MELTTEFTASRQEDSKHPPVGFFEKITLKNVPKNSPHLLGDLLLSPEPNGKEPPPVSIRPAVEEDAAELFPLALELSTSFRVKREAFEDSFTELLSAPDAIIVVAANENRLIGYLLGFVHGSFYANGKIAWIEEVMVDEAWRRQGVGGLLVTHFEQWATSHHSTLIALATRRASVFYQELGYEESATYFRKLL